MPPRKGREDRGAARGGGATDRPSSAILDTAFRRAYRATPKGDSRIDRARRRALLKIVRSGATTTRQLRAATARFRQPGLTPFEWLLVDRQFGDGTLGRALDRIGRAEKRIRGMGVDEQRALRRASGETEFGASVRRFYGRLASFVREVDPDLVMVRKVDSFLRKRPQLDPQIPTLVVAGFPNVGKSSLVGRLTRAHPKVAEYPFTTLSISAGHADLGFDRLQVLDTPGVLGRARRSNPAEREAESAVERAATIVLFVLDPTEKCGYPIDDQERLLARWQEEFPNLPFLEVETKADLLKRSNSRPKVSATSGEGLDDLRARLMAQLTALKGEPGGSATSEPAERADEIERVPPLRRANPK